MKRSHEYGFDELSYLDRENLRKIHHTYRRGEKRQLVISTEGWQYLATRALERALLPLLMGGWVLYSALFKAHIFSDSGLKIPADQAFQNGLLVGIVFAAFAIFFLYGLINIGLFAYYLIMARLEKPKEAAQELENEKAWDQAEKEEQEQEMKNLEIIQACAGLSDVNQIKALASKLDFQGLGEEDTGILELCRGSNSLVVWRKAFKYWQNKFVEKEETVEGQ